MSKVLISPSLILLFFLSPLMAFLPIMVEMYNGRKYAYWLFIIFWTLVAYLYPPQGDLHRYYQFYDAYKDLNYIDIFNYITDIVWYSILWLLAHSNIPFSFSQSILVLCYSITILLVLNKFSKYYFNKRSFFYLFIASFFLVPFWGLIGARFNLAISMYMLFIYYFFFERKIILYIIFSVLAILSHFSFLIFILLTLIAYRLNRFINIYIIITIGILLYLSVYSMGIYMENSGYDKAVYIVNQTDWLDNASPLLNFFYKYLCAISFWVLVVYIIKDFKTEKRCLNKIALLYLGISFALIDYPDMVGRFYSVFCVIASVILYRENLLFQRNFNWSKYLMIASIFVFLFSSITSYRAISVMKLDLLAKPIPFLLQHEYSYNWIDEHYINGDLINTKP